MNTAEKEYQAEISCLRAMCKKFEKENDVRSILRVKALIAYYRGMSPNVIAQCYEITEKTLKNWGKRFEKDEQIDDLPRSGRPSKLPKEKQEELRQMIAEQNQRIWVARHIAWLVTSVFHVCYSVSYLPEFLRKLGLSFHKAVHTLIQRDNEKRKKWIQETILVLYAEKIEQGWRIFFRIILPLIKPALVTSAIFSFYWSWDDFLAPLVYLNDPKLYTASLALRSFADPSSVTNWGGVFAMGIVALIPVFVLFILFQRYLVEGISTTGLKG
jgi:transposase